MDKENTVNVQKLNVRKLENSEIRTFVSSDFSTFGFQTFGPLFLYQTYLKSKRIQISEIRALRPNCQKSVLKSELNLSDLGHICSDFGL